ncbi:ead/Ea22-like family protein [Salmonella enterica]|nr:ead/Ea22-like family protein [Salmonella enterica]EBR1017252.1 ead/Ea22-like family protein [Salmonella enterica]
MSKIDHQALREAAERATPAMERLLMLPVDDDLLSEQELKDYGVDIDALNAFKFLAGPETVLALLDERERNQQYIKLRDQENEDIALTVGKLRVELEAAKKRLAELEKGHQEAAKQINSWRRLAKQNIAERGKDISELEAARQRIAELEAKLETADKLQDSAFRDGLKAGFSYGQTDDQSGFAQCMSAYSTRIGIKVKGE